MVQSPTVNAWVHSVAKLWMLGAQGIGPYSGKETPSTMVGRSGAGFVLLHALRVN